MLLCTQSTCAHGISLLWPPLPQDESSEWHSFQCRNNSTSVVALDASEKAFVRLLGERLMVSVFPIALEGVPSQQPKPDYYQNTATIRGWRRVQPKEDPISYGYEEDAQHVCKRAKYRSCPYNQDDNQSDRHCYLLAIGSEAPSARRKYLPHPPSTEIAIHSMT